MQKNLFLSIYFASCCFNLLAMNSQPVYDIFSFFKDIQSVFEVVQEEYDSTPCAMTSVITADGLTYLVVGFGNGDIVSCRPDGTDRRKMNDSGRKIKSLCAFTTAHGQTFVLSAASYRSDYQEISIWKLDGTLVDSFYHRDDIHSLVCVETMTRLPPRGRLPAYTAHIPEIIVGSRWDTSMYSFNGMLREEFEYADYIDHSGKLEARFGHSNDLVVHMTALTTQRGDTFIITADHVGDVIKVQHLEDSFWKPKLIKIKEFTYPISSLRGLHAFNSKDGNAYLIVVGRKDSITKWNLYNDSVETIRLPHHKRVRKFSFNECLLDDSQGECKAMLISFDDEIGFVCFDDNVSVFMENHELVMIKKMYPHAECWSVHMFTTPQGETFAALGIVKNPAESDDSVLIIKRVFFTSENNEII